jgi:hypothetical protein
LATAFLPWDDFIPNLVNCLWLQYNFQVSKKTTTTSPRCRCQQHTTSNAHRRGMGWPVAVVVPPWISFEERSEMFVGCLVPYDYSKIKVLSVFHHETPQDSGSVRQIKFMHLLYKVYIYCFIIYLL